MQIGGKLRSGKPHSGRAPDYDDWQLNGDILFYYPLLDCGDGDFLHGHSCKRESLDRQLSLAGSDDRRSLLFHRLLLEDKLPLTMAAASASPAVHAVLGKAHIGEVQSSIWDQDTVATCEQAGIVLL
jgi:aspartate--ammonia ligase